MRSFALSLVSIFAFGALSSAAPVSSEDSLIGSILSDNFGGLLSGNSVEVVGINHRDLLGSVASNNFADTLAGNTFQGVGISHRDLLGSVASNNFADALAGNTIQVVGVNSRDTQSLSVILTDLVDRLQPVTEQLKSVNAQDATVEHLTPIVNAITTILGDAIASVKGLVGMPVSEILATVDGELDAAGLARLLAAVFNLVLIAVGAVLDLVSDLNVSKLLCTIVSLLACLLQEVLSLVGSILFGVVGDLLPLIGDVLHFVIELNVEALLQILGIL